MNKPPNVEVAILAVSLLLSCASAAYHFIGEGNNSKIDIAVLQAQYRVLDERTKSIERKLDLVLESK